VCNTSNPNAESKEKAYELMMKMFEASVAESGFSEPVEKIAITLLQQAQTSGTSANPFQWLPAAPRHIQKDQVVQALAAFTYNEHAIGLVFDVGSGCHVLQKHSDLEDLYGAFELVIPQPGDPFDVPDGVNPFVVLMGSFSTAL